MMDEDELSTERTALQTERAKLAIERAALGKFADPTDAHSFIHPDAIDPDDAEAITAAIDELITRKPYLAARQTPHMAGDVDQGPRGNTPRPMTSADLARMSPEQIVEARRLGHLDPLLAGEPKGVMHFP